MKRDNNSVNFEDWTTKKLKDYAKEYHDMIYGQNACYGSSDIQTYDGVINELANRGINVSTKLTFN